MLIAAAVAPASGNAQRYVGAPTTHGTDPAPLANALETPAAKVLPEVWCGAEVNADDTNHEFDNGSHRFHAVYMYAADAPNRFAAFADTVQADAFQASSLLETAYDRAIRFDLGTSCGPQYLDITVVRLPETTAELDTLALEPNATLNSVRRGLNAAGFRTIHPTDTLVTAASLARNYLVWLDAPHPAGSCGQADSYTDPRRDQGNLNNFGGKTAIVFRDRDDTFCSSNTVRHEIGHNLGGLQPVAPHAFDGSHCNDAYEDTMCYANSPPVANAKRGMFFDYNNDDYWSLPGAPLAWWTVDLNRFLCSAANCNEVVSTLAGPTPNMPPVRALRARGEGKGVLVIRCRRAIRLPRYLRHPAAMRRKLAARQGARTRRRCQVSR